MRIENQSGHYSKLIPSEAGHALQSPSEKLKIDTSKEEAKENELDLKALKDIPDFAKTNYEKDEQKRLEKIALSGNSRLDPDQYDMVKKLEQIEREVIMHEKAHQATGGFSVGAVSYIYTMGPDYRYYATGGNVEYKLPYSGTPETMMRAFKGLKNAATSSMDASSQDGRMASMAEAKIQEIKNKISSDKAKHIYYEEMMREKKLREKRQKNITLN
ncbi:putative metalloprotease CJM1_0395 family protein [Fusibacter sp. JL216-2]|uniref:putative metalloprotease CJM1_0395 family protein n=1 Tax=Fusibacter sp. JL216-2 TaxID=3071453 RepID=UPI003D32DE55